MLFPGVALLMMQCTALHCNTCGVWTSVPVVSTTTWALRFMAIIG